MRLWIIGGVCVTMRPDLATPLLLPKSRNGGPGALPIRTAAVGSPPAGVARRARADTILILFQDFAAGGTERIMVRLANLWAEQRRVIIVCGSRAGPAAAGVSERVEIVEAAPELVRSPLSRWRLGRALTRVLIDLDPDIIVGPGNHILPVLATMRRPPVPVVCKLSNPLSLGSNGAVARSIQRWLHAGVFRSVSRVVAMCPALKTEAARFLPARKLTVIAEPILPDRRCVHAREERAHGLRLLFAGRLVPQKNPALAIRTLCRLPVSASLTIVGSGPERRRLERLASKLGVAARIIFTGQVPSIDPYLARADMLILPSRYEGYPAVLVEALAAGIPVVTTPCSPSLAEILIDPSFGTVSDANPKAMAKAIMAVGSAGSPAGYPLAQIVERHRATVSARKWLDCLDQVVRSA